VSLTTTDKTGRTEAAALPTRTRAAVLHGAHDLRTTELDVPALGDGDVLVRVAAVGVCGSDMHYFADGRNGQNVLRRPTVLGHEASGVVVGTGPGARVAVGTRVAVEPALGCGRCETCRAGAYNVCPNGTCLGSPPTHGTMTEYLVVPDRAAHPLPGSIDTVVGSMIEPLSVAVWAVQRAQVGLGDRVLVTGAGPIGLLVAQVARAAGAAEVIVTDVNDHRLGVAAELGATRTINTGAAPLDEDLRVDRVIECTGVPAVLWSSIRAVRPRGRVTVVGQAAPGVDGLPLAYLQRYEIDLVTAFRYAHAYPTAIALVASGAVDIDRIVTGRFDLERAAEAVQAPTTDPTHLKVVVTP
jgi:L-iditol 2-dehydrogenase